MIRRAEPIPGVAVRWEPGNGTSYHLVLTRDPQGGGLWSWVEETKVYACGWYGRDVRWSLGYRTTSPADRAAISAALLGGIPHAQALLAPAYRIPGAPGSFSDPHYMPPVGA